MKVSELSGRDLDYWTGKAEGIEMDLSKGDILKMTRHKDGKYVMLEWWRPSKDWAVGGPIIETNRIYLVGWLHGKWTAKIGPSMSDPFEHRATGKTPLEAACRVFVKSKFGEEVTEPAPESQLAG